MGVTQRQTQQLQPRRLREWVPGSSLLHKPIQTSTFSSSTPPKLREEQDGRVKDQAELPRGLRGVDQQADQHGILCLVRLSFHEFLVQPGRSSPPRIRWTFQDGVRGGARPWNGEHHLKPWRLLSSWRRRSTRAFSTCTRWPGIRATVTSATSLSLSTSASRYKASRRSAT